MKLCWIDLRETASRDRTAVIEEALHQRVEGLLSDDVADLEGLPPTVRKVYLPREPAPGYVGNADIVLVDQRAGTAAAEEVRFAHPGVTVGSYVEVRDAASLDAACASAQADAWSLVAFQDPTKIPLEIVLAAADGAEGSIITAVRDVEEAQIVFGVLERGSDGVLMPARAVGEVTRLKRAAENGALHLDLVELEITGAERAGMGERVCVDTCNYLGKDEGILVGSHSKGMILCVSETHPLPYMPTRPFRVNAGALHSYTLAGDARTCYLSELEAGRKVLAVDIFGAARLLTVGRVKIETRPLLKLDAVAADGTEVNLIVQDDWHVRVLGPGGAVLNSTELSAGDKVLGYLPTADRHVGYPISEFCLER